MYIANKIKICFDKLYRNFDITNNDDKDNIDEIILTCGNLSAIKDIKYKTVGFFTNTNKPDLTVVELLLEYKTAKNWTDETFDYIKTELGI